MHIRDATKSYNSSKRAAGLGLVYNFAAGASQLLDFEYYRQYNRLTATWIFYLMSLFFLFLITAMLYYHQAHFNLRPSIVNPKKGFELINEWLERPKLLYKGTGLQHQTFLDLMAWIRQETALDDTRYIRLEEKVAIFLHLCY
jgi:hypothetical protein